MSLQAAAAFQIALSQEWSHGLPRPYDEPLPTWAYDADAPFFALGRHEGTEIFAAEEWYDAKRHS